MKRVHLEVFSFVLLLAGACLLLSFPFQAKSASLSQIGQAAGRKYCVVLDAGHGGEDGGAAGVSGIAEKDLNLRITMLLGEMLEANGIEVVYTRTTDTLLYDRTVDYHGRKKALDLAARREIAENTPNCIFISIHMNSYPIEKYAGQQVWYSPNHPLSQSLAAAIREANHALLQPENTRTNKQAGSSIYLLHRLEIPSVLIECGFLSNESECLKLADEKYQKDLAFVLFLAISQWLSCNTL